MTSGDETRVGGGFAWQGTLFQTYAQRGYKVLENPGFSDFNFFLIMKSKTLGKIEDYNSYYIQQSKIQTAC